MQTVIEFVSFNGRNCAIASLDCQLFAESITRPKMEATSGLIGNTES